MWLSKEILGMLQVYHFVGHPTERLLGKAARGMAKGVSWSMKERRQAVRMKRQGATCADIAVR
jgi:hypothetical protein